MASNIILHELLSEKPYNLEKIRQFLERDHSSINVKDTFKRTPLVSVLMDSECSIDIVRLLLHFGADLNVGVNDYAPLLIALQYYRDEAIIEALLIKGANIDIYNFVGEYPSPVFYVLTNGNSPQNLNPEWKENTLNLLLQAGLDLNKVIEGISEELEGQSPLCLALEQGADVRDIELLMSKGASLNACQKHASPLHCVTDTEKLLKANVVQLLLDEQARKDEVFNLGLEPLQKALRHCRYETSAIRLLLEHSGENAVNSWIRQTINILVEVVENKYCKKAIVKYFLKRGACIDKHNLRRQTVLHSFMRSDRRYLNFLEFLLKSSAPVNAKCNYGYTPLRLAVVIHMKNYVINLLLAYGARLDITCDRNGVLLLETSLSALLRFNNNQESENVFKTLVKYYFLEFPNFNMQRLIEGHDKHEILSVFVGKCTDELHRMEMTNIRSDCTVRRFLSENLLLDAKTDQETNAAIEYCNQLLKIFSTNEFPEYFDVMASKMLASKVAEVVLESHLKSLIVFSFNAKIDKRRSNASAIKKVVLVQDVVFKNLAQFLSNEELLHLIVAFYNADDLPYNYNAPKERNSDSEQFTKLEKHRKLDQ